MTFPHLYVISDRHVADRARTLEVVSSLARALPHRVVAFGVRDHDASPRDRYDLAVQAIELLRPLGVKIIVHDRVDLALTAGADGVHLGRRSIAMRDARELLGRDAIVGASCHDEGELDDAQRNAADYVTLSPIFASPGKGAPLGVDRFSRLRSAYSTLAILALGGVDEAHVVEAFAAGASGVAMIRGAFAASSIDRLAARIDEAIALRR